MNRHWKKITLGEVTKQGKPIVYGIVQAGSHVPDGIPYLKSTDVGGEIVTEKLQRTSPEIAYKYRRSEVSPGDLVFSLRGNIGAISIVPNSLKIANLTQGTARISVKESILAQYIRYALANPIVSKEIAKVSKGSTFQEISLEHLRKIEILIPPYEEQEQIATILTTWDEAIAKTQALIEQKEKIFDQTRKKLTQTPGTSSVRHCHLSEITTEIIRRGNGQTHPVMMISSTQGFIPQSEKYGRDMTGESLQKYILLKQGEFAYNRGNSKTYPYGCIFRLEREEALVPFVYTCFALNEDFDSDYFRHYFEAGALNRQLYPLISSSARGNGLLNISTEYFFSCKIPLPDRDYQKQCAAFLNTGKQEIEILRAQLNSLQNQKQGLMQKLLSGTWSVNNKQLVEVAL